MSKLKFKLLGLATLLLLTSCTKKEDELKSAAPTDESYFTAAKQFIAHDKSFGPQTDLTTHQYRKKIEFHSSRPIMNSNVGQGIDPLNRGQVADILTKRKSLVMNSEGNLILLKRAMGTKNNPAETKVKLVEHNSKFDGTPSTTRRIVTACDAVVFNAMGEAACLSSSESGIVMTYASAKFGDKMISSCVTSGGQVTCNRQRGDKPFSPKSLDIAADVLTEQLH